jgi:hypothetical protein
LAFAGTIGTGGRLRDLASPLQLLVLMAHRHLGIDERPGPLPEIRAESDDLIFIMRLDEILPGVRLILRCADEEVRVSISDGTPPN